MGSIHGWALNGFWKKLWPEKFSKNMSLTNGKGLLYIFSCIQI
jgi:hypothetical protein